MLPSRCIAFVSFVVPASSSRLPGNRVVVFARHLETTFSHLHFADYQKCLHTNGSGVVLILYLCIFSNTARGNNYRQYRTSL